MEYTTLNNGLQMPMLGYGVFQIPNAQTEQCVRDALSVGYRLLDTAQAYANEQGVGNGIKASGVKREDIFLVDKIWMTNFGYEAAKKSIDRSLILLQTEYIDLMLLHQPFGDIYGAYQAMEDAHKEGKIRSLGVSNFFADRFIDFATHVEIKPAVNQVEANVYNQEAVLRKYLPEWNTKLMGWGPLAEGKNNFFTQPVLEKIGKKYRKSVAQVALRFLLQLGIIVIPKSVRIERMRENFDIFDFTLNEEEMIELEKLNTGKPCIIGSHEDPEVVKWFMTLLKK